MRQRIAEFSLLHGAIFAEWLLTDCEDSVSGAGMDNRVRGAWIVHHGQKISHTQAAAEYSAIDIAAKAAGLLARMAASKTSQLTPEKVQALGKAGNLSPRTDLPACLDQLQAHRVIDRSLDGTVEILGITSRMALDHASQLFDKNEPDKHELAALELGELVSREPVSQSVAAQFISDSFKLATADTADFIHQASALGFVEAEGGGADPLLFNGNLFRRDTVAKTRKVLDALSPPEIRAFTEFEQTLSRTGALHIDLAQKMLGADLLAKLRAAAIFDENIVSNEAGDHSFITSPGAFHKFSDPLQDDAFDHAKALVAALSYGMSKSDAARGQIWGVHLLLKKLVRGGTVGPVEAIGQDYRALELQRVVETAREPRGYVMRLVKREVGEIALQVLKSGGATSAVFHGIPGAQVRRYTGPEKARVAFRAKKDFQPSQRHMRSLLSSVRGGGGL